MLSYVLARANKFRGLKASNFHFNASPLRTINKPNIIFGRIKKARVKLQIDVVKYYLTKAIRLIEISIKRREKLEEE